MALQGGVPLDPEAPGPRGVEAGPAGPRGPAAAVEEPETGAPELPSAAADEPSSQALPAKPLPPVDADWHGNRADYAISARLDGPTKRLQASLVARWTNGMEVPATDLWFHLYLNAFSSNRSSHLFQSRGKLRGHELEEGWGWSDVTSIVVTPEGGEPVDVIATFRYRQPDDGRRDDRTVFSVDLPFAIEPGESVDVAIEWKSQLPRVRRRTGYKDDFLLVAQWFPKLGVFEGERGWNCHQFHMNSEFFSDYGTYDVDLDLPIEYEDKVFASGRVERSIPSGDRVLVTFRAPSSADRERLDLVGRRPVVHDFVWTGDPDFEVERFEFGWSEWAQDYAADVERAARAFGPEEPLRLGDVDLSVLIQPERAHQAERHARATSAALFFYGLWFGGYPYEHLVVVDPAWGASAAGGMEYPLLFTAGTSRFSPEARHQPESVTVHEAGHQFWYGLVGNNEFEAAWLDEGLNSYADSEVLWRVYGADERKETYLAVSTPGGGGTGLPLVGTRVVNLLGAAGRFADLATFERVSFGLPFTDRKVDVRAIQHDDLLALWRDQPWFTFAPRLVDPRMADRSRYLGSPDVDRVDSFAWEYLNRTSYVTNTYARPATALRSLVPIIGFDAFLRGMRHYAKTWRYRHPYPDDFFATFQEGAGVDVDWYFRETLRGTGTVDWSVEVVQDEVPAVRGFTPSIEGGWIDVTEVEEDVDELEPWRIEVTVRRQGTLRLPVTLRLAFEDASIEEHVWSREDQAGAQWKTWDLSGTRKLVAAVVDPRNPDDPERGYWLDTDHSNNEWHDERDRVAPLRWGERVLTSFQHSLWWYVGLGG
ncbi:MAG: hypothetical protein WD226_10280 [Planctomycetota bacterium]